MYEAVHAHPDGESTVSRMALTASEYGFSGIVVRNHGDQPASYDPAEIGSSYGIDIVPGVEIRSDDPSQASGFVSSHRTDQTIVAVHGGTPTINRFAVEQPQVDVLAHPMAGSGDFNHVLAKEANRNSVHIEFSLRDVLRDSGGSRVSSLQDLRKLREIVQEYETPFVVSADPRSHLQLRAPRELLAVGEAIGFSAEEIETGLAAWQAIAERNRERQSDEYVQPGVRRVTDDE
ncbi:RNase P subunit p30 family protein [Halobacteriaceae archaeon SHR40]|uniref:RNase P subunit p30 family protein n=1 Tax=Halovenus amylolytica TaxID=2500550 RepID=UPI000FE40B31